MESFDTPDLGEELVVQGMTITMGDESKTLCISHEKQVPSILKRAGTTDCKHHWDGTCATNRLTNRHYTGR